MPLARSVQILGINETGFDAANGSITANRTLPWLQDTAVDQVWTTWNPVYRDVIVVGPDGSEFGVFNLTSADLADPANYAALRQMFVDASAL